MNKLRQWAILFALACVLAFSGFTAAAPPGESQERWILGFHALPDLGPGDRYGSDPVVARDGDLRFLVVATDNPRGLEQRAAQDDRVRYLEQDSTDWDLFLVPNDPLHTHDALWGTHRIGAEAAWDVTTGSSSVKIAVVDSGLNKNHEEFAGQSRVLQGFDFFNGDTNPEDTNGCNFHGTHVSGTLGATINNGLGIAGISQSSILPAKIFHPSFFGCGTTTTAIVDALKFAGDQGAHISQNSWGGGGSSSAINDAIAYAHDRGVTHVAAAGNSGPCTNCVSQPWADNPDKTIVVSSLTDGDTFSSFSSQGPEVTVIAPGEFVGSSTSGTGDYHAYSGTSMAAPHVSGSLGLFVAASGAVGFSSLRTALTSNAEDLGMSSDRQGAGLVRIDTMLGGGGTPVNSPPTAGFTETCTDLTCDFTDTSTDSDGSVVSWSWDFGDGATSSAQNPSHTYAADGTFTVTLTVTDDDGATDTTSGDVTVSSGGGGGGITLSATGYKVRGLHKADLEWSGATSSQVDVYRDGALITSTDNDGFHTDHINNRGGASYTYQVCEAGTATCSNTATVNI